MEMSNELDQLAAALCEFQGEVRDAKKDKSGYGYNYADLSTILEIARPLMKKHGLSVVQMPGNAGVEVTVTTQLMHKSGQWIRDTITMPAEKGKGMSGAQAVGSVITYARRYSLAAVLGIAQSDDDAACRERDPMATQGHINRLRDLMSRTDTDEVRFTAHMRIADINNITLEVYNNCERALNKKLKLMEQQPKETEGEA